MDEEMVEFNMRELQPIFDMLVRIGVALERIASAQEANIALAKEMRDDALAVAGNAQASMMELMPMMSDLINDVISKEED